MENEDKKLPEREAPDTVNQQPDIDPQPEPVIDEEKVETEVDTEETVMTDAGDDENADTEEAVKADEVDEDKVDSADLTAETVSADEVDDKFKIEKEWADRLGIDFDPKAVPPPPQPKPVEQTAVPPAGYGAQQPPVPPYYGAQQPPYPGGQPPYYGEQLPPMHSHPQMPPTNLVWAIICTICCCLPFGIVAIVYSSQVSSRFYARDYEGARRASERAEWWIIAAIVVGVVFNALYIPLSLMMQP